MLKKLALTTALVVTLGMAPAYADMHEDGHEKDSHYMEEKAELGTVVDVAAGNEDFSTLVAAVQAAGLAETLATAEKVTVFAPTNEAFAKLPEGTVEDLLKPDNKDQLTSILTYHVLGQKIKSKNIPAGETTLPTLQGQTVTISNTDAGVSINGANVTAADIKASNGIIHVIDTVILPPEEKAAAEE